MSELINVKQSVRYPSLYVHKYKNRVFYDDLWDEDERLLESRGRIYDSKGNIVVNPFTKVFNYGERGRYLDYGLNKSVLAVEKINGFMAALTYNEELDTVLVSTTGSLDSQFVDRASSYLEYAKEYLRDNERGKTHLFEIVHHDDPHIIKENIGAYYLGYRELIWDAPYFSWLAKERGYDVIAKEMRCARPNYFLTTFGNILAKNKTIKHEGFMVYGDGGVSMKLKSPYYLVSKAYARRKDIFKMNKSIIPEEFYPLVEYLESYDEFNEISEQERLIIIRDFLENMYE